MRIMMAILFAAAAFAQTFEVATVKLAKPEARQMAARGQVEEMIRMVGGPGTKQPERIDYSGVTLRMMLKRAYDLDDKQIEGPRWIDSERYDVSATIAPGTQMEQFRTMLQRLLTERFQMSVHRETKRTSVYLLTIGKNGHKLLPPREASQTADPEQLRNDQRQKAQSGLAQIMQERAAAGGPVARRGYTPASVSIKELIHAIAPDAGRPIEDRTGLDGLYSFELRYMPTDGPQDSIGITIFQALEQQLGLRLEPSQEPSESLVIDKAEQVPTAN